MRSPPVFLLSAVLFIPGVSSAADAGDRQKEVAAYLTEMMVSARSVVSRQQELINDPEKGDKGFTKQDFTKRLEIAYHNTYGRPIDTTTHNEAHLMLMAMQKVVDDAQGMINKKGVGYKGFIPATFTRQAFEAFSRSAPGIYAKFTSYPDVHNPLNKPDAWETRALKEFLKPDYPRGQAFSEVAEVNGKKMLRYIHPEYFVASCLKCHGGPAGEKGPGGIIKCGKEANAGGAGFSMAFPLASAR